MTAPVWAVWRHGIRTWWKDRRSVMVGLLMPVLLFFVFALVFSTRRERLPVLEVAWLDHDRSEVSERLLRLLESDGAVRAHPVGGESLKPFIASGKYLLGVEIGAGLQDQLMRFRNWDRAYVRVYHQATEGVRTNMLRGYLAKAGFLLLAESWSDPEASRWLSDPSVDPRWRRFVRDLRKALEESHAFMQPRGKSTLSESLLSISVEEVQGGPRVNASAVQQMAGVAVMFLLFSVARAGGVVLEEKESGTLKRILSSPITESEFLFGKFLSVTTNGFVQVGVLCLVGWLSFRVPIFRTPMTLALLVLATAAAAAAFGLCLATFCRTRDQVQATATFLILAMSLIGGSMVPKFLLPAWAQKLSVFTLNGWAMEGFLKVLLHGQGMASVWPDLAALFGMGGLFMLLTLAWLPRQLRY